MNIVICTPNPELNEKYLQWIEHDAMRQQRTFTLTTFTSAQMLLFTLEQAHSHIDLIYLSTAFITSHTNHIAQQLRADGYRGEIIYTSVDQSHALDGYDHGVFHYLIEPTITESKFQQILQRVWQRRAYHWQETLTLSQGSETRHIPLASIMYFEIQTRIVTVYYEQTSFAFYSTMAKLEAELLGKGFIRIHKSFLVNKNQLSKQTSQHVVLQNGVVLPIGRRYRENVRMQPKRE